MHQDAYVTTLTGNEVSLYTKNSFKVGTHSVVIKLVVTDATEGSFELLDTLVVEVLPECKFTSFTPSLRLAESEGHEIPIDNGQALPFQIAYTPPECDLIISFHAKVDGVEGFPSWMSVDKDTGGQLSPILKLDALPGDIANYDVEIFASVNTIPPFFSTDNILSQIVIYGDACVQTELSPISIPDRYILIRTGDDPVTYTFAAVTDSVSETTDDDCGAKAYVMSGEVSNGQGDPNFITFDPDSRTLTLATTSHLDVGVYDVQVEVTLVDHPDLNDLIRLVIPFKVLVDSECLQTTLHIPKQDL